MRQELEEQLAALTSSIEAFEAGKRWEAKRIATAVYTLVHDGGRRSRALLTQLGLKKEIKFLSSMQVPAKSGPKLGFNSRASLVRVRMGGGQAYFTPKLQPPEGEPYSLISFGKWWEEVIFVNDLGGFNRRNLVHFFRSQDGGAHVDEELTEGYRLWKQAGDPNLRYEADGGSVRVLGPIIELATGKVVRDKKTAGEYIPYAAHAAMCQIGWEVNESIRQHGQ